MDVPRRADLVAGGLLGRGLEDGLRELLAGQQPRRFQGLHRRVPRAQVDQPRLAAAAGLVEGHPGRDAGLGVVAVAAGDLQEGPAGAGRGGRNGGLGQDLLGLQGGGEQAGEETGGVYPAVAAGPAQAEAGAEGHGERRQLGRRIGVGQTAAEGPPVADLRMGDEGDRLVEQRRRRGHQRVPLQAALARQGADPQGAVRVPPEEVELRHAVDVDQERRLGQPEIHHRDEALPAGQDLGVAAVPGEQVQRGIQRGRSLIVERSGLHADVLPSQGSPRILPREARVRLAAPPRPAGRCRAPGRGPRRRRP